MIGLVVFFLGLQDYVPAGHRLIACDIKSDRIEAVESYCLLPGQLYLLRYNESYGPPTPLAKFGRSVQYSDRTSGYYRHILPPYRWTSFYLLLTVSFEENNNVEKIISKSKLQAAVCYCPYFLWKKVEGGLVRGITVGMSEFSQAEDRSRHVERFLEAVHPSKYALNFNPGCARA